MRNETMNISTANDQCPVNQDNIFNDDHSYLGKRVSKLQLTPYALGVQLMLVSPADTKRAEIERFIADGYQKHFNAKLMDFFPIILAIRNLRTGRVLSAVGLRYADDYQLFSENYLDNSIESELTEKESVQIDRIDVIELGHFVADQTSDMTVVIPLIGNFLKTLSVKWAVYTLSRPIKIAFNRMGIKLTHIQHAHPDAVIKTKTDWGKYYDYKPAVYYSSIINNLV